VIEETVTPGAFKTVLGQFPTGVVVITGHDGTGPVGLTVQSFMALSLDPMLVLVSVDRKSTSWPAIASTGRFVVNILASGQHDVAVAFAKSGGDKFAGVEWTPSVRTGAPRLPNCQAWIECEIAQTHGGGDHHVVVARAVGLSASTDPELHPLIFFRSAFQTLDRSP
jgi:3-hydroxy-9,10-secoandrosta-1,3,5(10)-triene-9,17-dione monooxygenase reductase component